MNKPLAFTILSWAAIQPLFAATVPAELESTQFSGPDLTPSPAVICASPTGEVFVGVDMQGSLGKLADKGKIVRLVDTNNDGKADKHTDYAKIDNPRGLIALGDKLIVLHSTVKDGKPYNQNISVYTDANNDGIADGPPKPLVTGIGNPKFIQGRGADHCTNNIRLGIDGWIYVSVGDFGFIDAKGTDGKTLSMHGGGVVRVRPDGSELETFIHGTRNVYDVSIDPFMNVFTRENTNDGVGWWIRFSHYIQSGEYGYPSLYTNFPEDMIPALGEYGSGSGTGCLYFEEPGWPAKYNKQNLLADWGRSMIFIHRVKPDGASFTNEPEPFIGSSQVADLDVDASGRMYIAAWDGAGYKGSHKKGYVERVVPKNWKYKPFPNLLKIEDKHLYKALTLESHTARTYASQELVRRKPANAISELTQIAKDNTLALATRVAAVYTLAQIAKNDAHPILKQLATQSELREHAIRCMADRLDMAKNADTALLVKALDDANPRVQVAAAIALGRTQDLSIADALVKAANPPAVKKSPAPQKETTSNTVKSKPISKLSDHVSINVDITSYKTLYLIVSPEGNNGNDHAAWIKPTVITKDGKNHDLTKIKWKSAKSGWGKTNINKDCINKRLKATPGIGTHAYSVIAYDLPKNAVKFTATGIMTPGSKGQGKVSFIVSSTPPKGAASGQGNKTHSTPNSAMILPHVARQSLLLLDAQQAVIKGIQSNDPTTLSGALATAKFMHSGIIVDALATRMKTADDTLKQRIFQVLARLHQKEVDYDGSTWWQTRPDPHGPYYYPTDWAGTTNVESALLSYIGTLNGNQKNAAIATLRKNKAYVTGFNDRPADQKNNTKTFGKTAIEDLILYLEKAKGNAANGKKVIQKVGCIACHNITPDAVVKGPDLTQYGNTKKADILAALKTPAATIAKSWVSITLKNGNAHMGTIVKKTDAQLTLHDIAGNATTIAVKDIAKTQPGPPTMSIGLCDPLTLQETADLIEYIQSMDKNRKK